MMTTFFDIQAKAKHLLTHGRLVETGTLAFDSGVFDVDEADGLVEGGMGPGGVAKGKKSILINGDVLGNQGNECRLVFSGDVIIVGQALHAHITAKNIWVGKGVNRCQLTCVQDIGIGGVAKDSDLKIGNISHLKQYAELGFEKIRKTKDRFGYAERKLNLEERHLDRLIKSTQFNLEFTAGGMLQRSRNKLKINLRKFYEALEGRTPEDIDKALIAFFGKAIVGLLTKSNRHLIQNNPNRRKVFMGLIRALYDLILLTRKCDRLRDELLSEEKGQKILYEEAKASMGKLWLGGGVAPNLGCSFVVPDVELLTGGELSIVTDIVNAQIVPGNDSMSVCVKKIHLDGDSEQVVCPIEGFQNVIMKTQEGKVVWGACEEMEELQT